MTSNTRTTGTTRTTVATLEKRFNAFETAQAEHNQQVLDLLTALKPTTATSAVKGKTTKPATKASKKDKPAKAGLTFKEQQAALKALKVSGTAPAGMTVKQAVEAGLLKPTFTPERAPKVEVTTKAAKGKTTKAKATEGTPFPVLKAALKAHKASGAIPAQHNGTYVSVKSAIADRLMNADGSLPGTKAPKAKSTKAKGAQVVAVASDATPAYEAPRRSDGTITPKREWALREQLAETGKFDRFQIDKRVAKAVRKGLI